MMRIRAFNLCLLVTVVVKLLVLSDGATSDCLTVEFLGRMGNLMFEYASLVGICTARHLDYRYCAHMTNTGWNTWDLPITEFIQTFNLPRDSSEACTIVRKRYYREKSFVYDANLLQVQYGTTIQGWLQSWKYFHPHAQNFLRELYVVPTVLAHKAENFILNIRNHLPTDFVLIGVHVRLGDKLNNKHTVDFYDQWSLSEAYYRKAIALLTKRHKHSALIFFSGGGETNDGLSSDRHWTKERFSGISNYTFFDHSEDHFTSFHALSLCDALVVAHSSFSWWSAYLSSSMEVVAPYHLYTTTAAVKEGYIMEDYYLPWWSVISQNSSEDRIIGWDPNLHTNLPE